MPPDIDIKIDVTDVQAVLAAIADDANKQRIAERVADDVVLPALSRDKYPSPSGAPMHFVSAKQRAYVMAAIRSGAIKVPYQRTGDTGASYQKSPIADGVTVVSSKASAEFTRGPGQAAYHKGNWPTHEDVATSLEGEAAKVATDEMTAIIGDAAP